MNERGHFLGKVSGELFLGSERVEIKNSQNLEKVRTHLKTGSVIAYFDHFARFDSVIYGKVVKENITSLNNLASWVAIKYTDKKRNPLISYLLKSWQEEYGFKLFPIVQPEDKNKYPNAKEINNDSFNRAVEFLRQPGHVLMVAPEGKRSHTNKLLRARRGFEMLLKNSPDSLILPIAGVHSRALPVVSKTIVIIGEPFTYWEILQEHEKNSSQSVTDLAMIKLAKLLPQQNRGFYR
jgi:1-acyl-sn-glycerol-3-phosphate acyltransferase